MTLEANKIYDEYVPRDIHHVQPILMWELEWKTDLLNDPQLETELAREDIWVMESHHRNLRGYYDRKSSKFLEKLAYEFTKYKQQFTDMVFDTNKRTIGHYWAKPKEYYSGHLFMPPIIYKDMPTFDMVPHIDSSHIMIQSIINLVDNGDMGTEFYYPDSHEPFYKSIGTKGKGGAFLNTHASIHGIRNITKPRYILYVPMFFAYQLETK
jgi:hypothetical protein